MKNLLKIRNIKNKLLTLFLLRFYFFVFWKFLNFVKMVYYYIFSVKIKKQEYNKNLYEFCKYYEDIIVTITYLVTKKVYEIIIHIENTDYIKEVEQTASKIFKDLKLDKDFETYYMSDFEFYKLSGLLFYEKISFCNPRMYLYYSGTSKQFKIEKIPIVMFDILYNFKISNMKEIICWFVLFLRNLINKNYEMFIKMCIKRYYDNNSETVNINKYKGLCWKNKRIQGSINEYVYYSYYVEELKYDDPDYPYIDIERIPNVSKVYSFMEKEINKRHLLDDSYSSDESDYSNDSDYSDESYSSDESEYSDDLDDVIKVKKSKKPNKLDELDEIEKPETLQSTIKENSIIENNIFNNDDEEEDNEYFEIIRIRRIKKSFMINN